MERHSRSQRRRLGIQHHGTFDRAEGRGVHKGDGKPGVVEGLEEVIPDSDLHTSDLDGLAGSRWVYYPST